MNAKESLPHALGRKALDAMIRREYGGWPPVSSYNLHQPHRPEKLLPKPQDKKYISRCSSKPVASQMRRAFLCLLLEKFTKSSNN